MKSIIMSLSLFISILLCYAMCRPAPPADRGKKQFHGNQGIFGTIRWVEGNLMPTPGDSTYLARSQGKGIARTIYIYHAVTNDELDGTGPLYRGVRAELVKAIDSKSNGTFHVVLPPGRYSLFVMEKEGFFANKYDGGGLVNAVTVQQGKFTEYNILVNYKAYY